MAQHDTPLSVARVALTVQDLDRVGAFYRDVVGLEPLARDGESMALGVGGVTLIELRRDPAARPHQREAGLFHTAFLLPGRADLGRWLRRAADDGTRLDGVADHLVSEALYLHDPEGNGVEIYADRPRSQWQTGPGGVKMATLPLDVAGLVADAPGAWAGAPPDTIIGHVHLQVGDVAQADAFYTGALGMERMAHLPQASFYATGGYHHHLAANSWQSAGAGLRSADSTGLAELTLQASPARLAQMPDDELVDPWGNRITITAA